MNWPRICTAVIPCLDEAATIGDVVLAVRQQLPAVFVVDDGSTDHTADVARRAGAEVITHGTNRGKGAALRTGLREAAQRGFTWALLLDGDGQHDPRDIPTLLAVAAQEDVDLVIGNRLDRPEGLPAVRRGVNRWMSRRISRRLGFVCPDSQCGFRLLRVAAWESSTLVRDHYETESELLVVFANDGRRIRFAPVRCLPAQRASHIRLARDTWRWFRWWQASRRDTRKT